MYQDPIFSGGWIKAALVILVAGALGVGAYLLASGVDINLPDLNTGTNGAQTLSNTTLEDTTIGEPKPVTTTPAPKAPKPTTAPGIQQFQQLNSCIQAAGNDIDKITACFDRFNGQ